METKTRKEAEIAQYKGELKGLSLQDLNKELLRLCNYVMSSYPNGYHTKLKANNKYCALVVLIREKKKG